MTDCLADETIAAWADNALLPDERERAIEHVASCEVCRAVVGHLMMTSVHAPTPAKIGRYEIRGALGAGGMGVVLRGHDPVLGREVAIKMIKSTLVEPAHRHRMLREARAIAKVRHPNVVSVHELGEAGDELYVAMELVAGTMLQRWLGTPRPVEQRIALVLAIGRGLAAVHAAELLHRDIKPDNIVVRDDGTPVLVDFGLARDTAVPAFGAGSGIAGTPRYLAPEVASGRAATAASDQYQWWTIVEDALPDLRAVRPLVERGHDPDPARRFASMRDAVAALERAVATRPPRARWIVAGLGVLAVAGAITQLRAARTGPVCDASWPKGWSPERRLAVERSLRTAGLDPARALASLDRRVARTLELRERGCVESARGASERAEWTRRLVCVDETWAKTGRSVAALVRPDPAQVREAADELAEVPPVERCERGSLSAVPEALAPAQQARYEALAETIQRLETDSSVKPPERLAKLRAMQPDIDALHYAPLDARWRWGLGHALSDAHDLAAAAKEFAVSAETGLAAGDDNLYVRALIAQLHQTRAGSADQIALLESQAEAGARRLANPQVDAQLLIARANVYMERGDNAKARTLFERADAVYQQIALAPMAMHVMVLQNLGAICLETGDMAAGDRYLDRAVELARLRYTDAGAPYWEARGARATSYLFRKDLAKAEPELRAAADGIERTSPTSGQAGMLRAYLCILLLGKNQVADARAQCAASVQAMQALGADTPAQVWPLTLSGQVELRDDHVDLALAFLERAVRLAEQNHVRPIELTVAQAYYAIALRAGKRTADANALARIVAPKLRDPAVAESRGDFVRYFPELRAQASP